MKDDGSLHYRGEVTPLQRVLLARRSYRKYREGPVDPAQVQRLEAGCARFCAQLGFLAPRVRIVAGRDEFTRIIGAASKGLVGLANPWLPMTRASAVVLGACDTAAAPVRGDRALAIAQTAMALEALVLHATELGLASCWLAGINGVEVEHQLGFPPGHQLIAMILLGQAPAGVSMFSWDGVAHHLVSKRRKPLDGIVFEETLPPATR